MTVSQSSRWPRRIAMPAVMLIAVLAAAGCGRLTERSQGEELWRENCARCHGIDGAGSHPKYSRYAGNNLLDNRWVYGGEPLDIESVIREGIFPNMPAFEELTNDEIDAIIAHIRELRGGA